MASIRHDHHGSGEASCASSGPARPAGHHQRGGRRCDTRAEQRQQSHLPEEYYVSEGGVESFRHLQHADAVRRLSGAAHADVLLDGPRALRLQEMKGFEFEYNGYVMAAPTVFGAERVRVRGPARAGRRQSGRARR